MSSVLKKKDFIAWLASKEPNEVVGIRGKTCLCPLAKYLWSIYPDCMNVRMDSNSYSYRYPDGTGKTVPAPKWTFSFIARVDLGNYMGDQVTAKQALEIIQKPNLKKGETVRGGKL